MNQTILGFKCPHGIAGSYEECGHTQDQACVDCRAKMELIRNSMRGVFVGKWISVKDRLPDKSVKTLVAAKEYGGNYQITVSLFTGHYFSMTGRRAHWKITHWMPLPEPPKEG